MRAFPCFEVVDPKERRCFLKETAHSDDVKTIGFESGSLTVKEYHKLVEDISLPFVPCGDILERMRTIKSEEEVAAIRRAQAITDEAFSHILGIMTPAMTETDIALELSYYMHKHGAERCSFDIIAASGSASALPHAKCRNQPISKGFLTMDFGCVFHGYCSDMTRTVSIGKATEEMRHIYETVLEAQLTALSLIRADAGCKDVDAVARAIIDSEYSDAFCHSLGHGVGLDIHEMPSLSPRAGEERLACGNVVTVEPGIYLAGKYGCRIEDMGVVTEKGFDDLTTSTKQLIELFV